MEASQGSSFDSFLSGNIWAGICDGWVGGNCKCPEAAPNRHPHVKSDQPTNIVQKGPTAIGEGKESANNDGQLHDGSLGLEIFPVIDNCSSSKLHNFTQPIIVPSPLSVSHQIQKTARTTPTNGSHIGSRCARRIQVLHRDTITNKHQHQRLRLEQLGPKSRKLHSSPYRLRIRRLLFLSNRLARFANA